MTPKPNPQPPDEGGKWKYLSSSPNWDFADSMRQKATNANPGKVVVLKYEAGVYRIMIREGK